jgi:OmpA-OmpF porin, OOP family
MLSVYLVVYFKMTKLKYMYKRISLFLYLLFVVINLGLAQNKNKHYGLEDKELIRKVKIADYLFDRNSYYRAIALYGEVLDVKPRNSYVVYKMGRASFHARDYVSAEEYLKLLIKLNKHHDYPMGSYFYAEALRSMGRYDEAKTAFLDFMKIRTRDAETRKHKNIALHRIKSCDYAMEIITEEDWPEEKVEVLEGSLNKAYGEFSPRLIGQDTLMFASLPADTVMIVDFNEPVMPVVKLFMAVKKQEKWSTVNEFDQFNHPFQHTANGVYSPDRSEFYFSRCLPDIKNNIKCALYMSHKGPKGWTKPKKMPSPVNKKGYTCTQPTLGSFTVRGKEIPVLYFVSDRKGGRGGMDLWYALKGNSGQYSKVYNCGGRINSPGDEVSPYYDDETKMMFFSSNYHENFGGFDVFKAEGWINRWASPKNMGRPINSSFDDTYFVFGEGLEKGFMVSNRQGSTPLLGENCCDDIFTFKRISRPLLTFHGTIITEKDSLSAFLNDVMIGFIHADDLQEDESFDQLKDKVTWVNASDSLGKFYFQHTLSKKHRIVFGHQDFYPKVIVPDGLWNEEEKEHQLISMVGLPDSLLTDKRNMKKEGIDESKDREDLNEEIAEMDDIDEGKIFVLRNLNFDYDKDNIKDEFLPQLKVLLKFMRNKPEVKIELSGHSDSRGSPVYNQTLSQRRADQVRNFLISQGIDKNRVVSKGYGSNKPIAPNQHDDGSDNPEGRFLNRRIEITVIKKEAMSIN